MVNKIKIQAIVDSGAPCNIILSKLVKKLGLQPDIDHQQNYGTAGTETVQSLGAYSALPMKFGKLFLSAPAVVLPNCNYDILLGTSFLLKYGIVTDFKNHTLNILGQHMPIYFSRTSKDTKPGQKFINLEFTDGIIPVAYVTRKKKTIDLPEKIDSSRGIPLRADSDIIIESGTQKLCSTAISVCIPSGMHGTIISPWKVSRIEPLVAPGLILPNHTEINVLLGNLGTIPISIKRDQIVAYLHLEANSNITEVEPIGSIADIGLPEHSVNAVYSTEDLPVLSNDQQTLALDLFEKYKEVFAEDDFDLGCATGVIHTIDTGDHRPICS
jgi:dUTPase